ncbi:MAG: hypothetical protein GF311_21400 [Candidatus Lokiarchaeota archaeon]|nr:hypothetical protein [Candidatus Lokiarchaeota archaeon]
MIKGLAIFSWDQKIGSVLEAKYPDSLEITSNLTNKIYMTHAYDEDFKNEELIEVNYNDKTILSYCDKARVSKFGYEILILILEETEKDNLYNLKNQLISFGSKVFSKPPDERTQYFLENVSKFFKKSSARKVLLLGRPGTGKTSIKKIIFEGVDPRSLLYDPLEPTRGVKPSVYSWLDLKLGLFDTSGQELLELLNQEDSHDQMLAFDNADVIIYLFDFPFWVSRKEDVVADIARIKSLIETYNSRSELYLFLHKIDLIEENDRETTIKEVKGQLGYEYTEPIFFTSIYPKLIYSLYNAFYTILSTFSADTKMLKLFLDEFLKDTSKTLAYITNKNDSIIVQTMNKDFNTNLINHTHKMIAQLNQSFQNMVKNDNIEHIIISGRESLNIIMNYLNLMKFNINNLILISETLTPNRLISLVGKIRSKLINYYFYQRK